MTAERQKLSSQERFRLAAVVNRFCDAKLDESVTETYYVGMARELVEALDPLLDFSSENHFNLTMRGKSQSFGGLAPTGQGDQIVNIPGEAKGMNLELGRLAEERLGLYKVSKDKGRERGEKILIFCLYTEQIDLEKEIVHIGPTTSIVYTDGDKVKAVVRSIPMALKLGDAALVWYRRQTVWGKGSIPSSSFSFIWGF